MTNTTTKFITIGNEAIPTAKIELSYSGWNNMYIVLEDDNGSRLGRAFDRKQLKEFVYRMDALLWEGDHSRPSETVEIHGAEDGNLFSSTVWLRRLEHQRFSLGLFHKEYSCDIVLFWEAHEFQQICDVLVDFVYKII